MPAAYKVMFDSHVLISESINIYVNSIKFHLALNLTQPKLEPTFYLWVSRFSQHNLNDERTWWHVCVYLRNGNRRGTEEKSHKLTQHFNPHNLSHAASHHAHIHSTQISINRSDSFPFNKSGKVRNTYPVLSTNLEIQVRSALNLHWFIPYQLLSWAMCQTRCVACIEENSFQAKQS